MVAVYHKQERTVHHSKCRMYYTLHWPRVGTGHSAVVLCVLSELIRETGVRDQQKEENSKIMFMENNRQKLGYKLRLLIVRFVLLLGQNINKYFGLVFIPQIL